MKFILLQKIIACLLILVAWLVVYHKKVFLINELICSSWVMNQDGRWWKEIAIYRKLKMFYETKNSYSLDVQVLKST